MTMTRKTALAVGVLFIITFITSIGAALLYGPIVDQQYDGPGLSWWNLHVGTRITREIWVLGGYDYYSEMRRTPGRCPDEVFPCPDGFIDDIRMHALTVNVRWT